VITLGNLDLVRADSIATADAFGRLQRQVNAQPSLEQTQLTVGAAGSAAALPATPTAYLEVVIKGVTYVTPLYEKD
jgi:hypothetical protein